MLVKLLQVREHFLIRSLAGWRKNLFGVIADRVYSFVATAARRPEGMLLEYVGRLR